MLNDSKWIGYRLGDIIKGVFLRIEIGYLDKIEKELPNSIGGMYIKRTKGLEYEEWRNNYEVLQTIIEEKAKDIDLPSENDIVFHVRLGDIVVDFRFGDVFFYKKDWGLTLKEIKSILQKVKKNNAGNKIILVYGSHKTGINQKANNKYLKGIKKLIIENGFEIESKNSSNPDNDFIYMSQSKKFIRSGGGFSRITGRFVKKNGGIVFGQEPNGPLSFDDRCKHLLVTTIFSVKLLLTNLIKRFPKTARVLQRLKR
jgi:hypothetical protein